MFCCLNAGLGRFEIQTSLWGQISQVAKWKQMCLISFEFLPLFTSVFAGAKSLKTRWIFPDSHLYPKPNLGEQNSRSHCGLILPDFSPSVLRFSTSSAFVKQQTFILSMTFFSSLIDHQSKQWYLQTPKLLVITGQSQCQFVWFGKTKLFLSVVVKIDAIYNRLRKSETMGGMLHRRGAPPPSIHPEVFADRLSDRWQHSQWDGGLSPWHHLQ